LNFLLEAFDHWLFDEYEYSFEDLGIYRVLFAVYVLLVGFPSALWVRDAPPVSFSPPLGLMAFFTNYPPNWSIVALNAVAFGFTALLLVGLHTPLTSIGTGLSFIAVRSICFADGKIDHDILLGLAPLVLAGSGWGNVLSFDALRGRPVRLAPRASQPWLLAVLALLIGLCILSAGLAKLRGGWLHLETHATVWHLLPNYYLVGRAQPLAKWALGHFPGALWEAMDWSTTIWECTVVLSVMRRRAFLTACCVGCLFHFGVWQLFDIAFGSNVVVYAAFVPWKRVFGARDFSRAFTNTRGKLALVVALTLGGLALFVFRDNFDNALSLHVNRVVVAFGGLVAAAHLWRSRSSLFPARAVR